MSDQIRVVKAVLDDAAPLPPSGQSRKNGGARPRGTPTRPTAPTTQRAQAKRSNPPETAQVRPPRATESRANNPRDEHDGSRAPKLIVTIQRSDDHATDVAKLRLLHELLTEFEGRNPFKFHLIGGNNKGTSLELDFPNDRTHYCPELTRELVAMLGPDCYQLQ
jgi:hypothetical protein